MTHRRSTLLLLLLSVFTHVLHASAAMEHWTLDALEAQLQEHEAQFDDLVLGTEKHVRWFDEAGKATEYAIVYLHGFSASRQELNPLVDQLADKLQANVFFTRLKGHGRSDNAMAEGSVEAWKNDTLEAYNIGQLLGQKVIVVGTSTGATLSTWLNTQGVAQNMHATIHISPNYAVRSKTAAMLKWSAGLWLAKILNGDYHSFEPLNEFHGQYWTERYPLDAVVPMLRLVDEVNDVPKSAITTPQLIVYSPEDKVIDVKAITRTAQEMTSAAVTLVPFTISQDPYQHVLVGKASSVDQVDDMLGIFISFLNDIEPHKKTD